MEIENKKISKLKNSVKNKNDFNNKIHTKSIFSKFLIVLSRHNLIIYLYLLYSILTIKCEVRKIQVNDYIINLKIKGIGFKFFLHFTFTDSPDEVHINGNKLSDTPNRYNFEYPENNVTMIWNRVIESFSNIFYNCEDIIEVDLSNFDSSKIKNMNNMFVACHSLRYINFTNFITSKTTSMNNMFVDCSSLTSLDLSNFDTSNVKNMEFMFKGCSKLTSLNLSNFDTSKVENMQQMFYDCSSLTSLDLSNFNTSKVKKMTNMFYNCFSLTSLDLANFNASIVTAMVSMFYNCTSLKYLFLSNFDFNKDTSLGEKRIFELCTSLEFINLKQGYFDTNSIYKLTRLNSNNLTICSDKHDKFSNYFTNIQKMICSDKNMNNNNQNISEFKCHFNHSLQYNKHFCDICGKYDFFQLYNDEDKNNSYIICSNSTEGYYLDLNDLLYKQCYLSCKICNQSGNDTVHNCLECKEEYMDESYVSNNKNCYKINSFNITSNLTHLISNSYYSYDIKSDILTDYSIISSNILSDTNYYYSEYKSDNIEENTNEINSFSTNEIKNETILTNSYSNDITNKIENYLINEANDIIISYFDELFDGLNLIEINNGNDKTINKDDSTFIFTSSKNQKNNKENKKITMDLGQCENIIRSVYNISQNNPIYIFQTISKKEGMNFPKLEYELYYSLNNKANLAKINISICQEEKIEISYSVDINETFNKYNPKSDYYNNICIKSKSEFGTDISLKNRKKQFIINNMSLCEENCELIDYNYITKKVICSCEAKSKEFEYYNNNELYKEKSLNDFNNIKNIFLDLNIIKCYKAILNIKSLKKNIGCLIAFIFLLLYFITLFTFQFRSYHKLKIDIGNILFSLKSRENSNEGTETNKPIISKNKNKKIKAKTKTKKKISKKKKEIRGYYTNNNNKNQNDNLESNNVNSNENYVEQMAENLNEGSAQRIGINEANKIIKYNDKVISFNKKYLEIKDFEINTLEYQNAILLDNRNCCEYYISLLKNNHHFLFSFCSYKDYNSKILKIFLFFFLLNLYITINLLFFSDKVINKIYEDKGKFNFLYHLPQILFSTIISKLIFKIIKIFALSQGNIVKLKREKNELNEKYVNLMRRLKIKFIIFFIISFIILIFSFTFIACFCAIYENSQIHLFKNSGISFIIGLIYPFGLYLMPVMFRICALRAEKQNRKCLYDFSTFFESCFG